MKSKKKLFEALDKHFKTNRWSAKGLKHSNISDETYGRRSMIYVSLKTPDERDEVERLLKRDGFGVQSGYWPDGPVAEIQVSYFKGHHWDE